MKKMNIIAKILVAFFRGAYQYDVANHRVYSITMPRYNARRFGRTIIVPDWMVGKPAILNSSVSALLPKRSA